MIAARKNAGTTKLRRNLRGLNWRYYMDAHFRFGRTDGSRRWVCHNSNPGFPYPLKYEN
jgi:hypothetical protein